MARALRVDLAGAWYHVINRGHRGEALYQGEADRRRFLGAVGVLPERYGIEVHAFVLMDNHHHLLVRTTEANLSHAIRWLNVSYAVKFNGSTALTRPCSRAASTRHGGLRLAEVVREVGVKYQAAAQAVKRFGQALPDDQKRQRFIAALQRGVSTI